MTHAINSTLLSRVFTSDGKYEAAQRFLRWWRGATQKQKSTVNTDPLTRKVIVQAKCCSYTFLCWWYTRIHTQTQAHKHKEVLRGENVPTYTHTQKNECGEFPHRQNSEQNERHRERETKRVSHERKTVVVRLIFVLPVHDRVREKKSPQRSSKFEEPSPFWRSAPAGDNAYLLLALTKWDSGTLTNTAYHFSPCLA